ncbi:MAG TPA: proline dehydrogenase family protein [Actinomycetota bacterium]|nr:proline dehydrogenase family protein [Actinomycetota bacterium]
MNGPLLRGPVLRLTEAGWFRRLVTGRLGRPLVARFVAGEHLDDAVRVAKALDGQKISTILDHLGENVTAPEHAAEAVGAYARALDRIRVEPFLDLTVSVKLTQLGLDFSHELCVANMERVLEAAAEMGTLVMIDMESSAYVDRTVRVFRELRERHERVGLALQTCLRRTARDVDDLPDGSVIRIVKGAYLEPPEVAFTTRREVDSTFAQLTATLLSRGHVVHIATHDPALLDGTVVFVQRRGIPWTRVEFQMLYGIRRDLQNRLANEGYPVRVYVPYGTEWYPYLTRRMAERPANIWFFASNLVRFGR